MKTASLLQIHPSQGVTRPFYHEPLAAPTTQGEISEQSTRAARSTAVTVTEIGHGHGSTDHGHGRTAHAHVDLHGLREPTDRDPVKAALSRCSG